ncbi:MAG TPA: hypothetical protein VD948_07625 [Rhodothermales bacterium]|nr:hypothetical protein [Rhodothermales bacterium]
MLEADAFLGEVFSRELAASVGDGSHKKLEIISVIFPYGVRATYRVTSHKEIVKETDRWLEAVEAYNAEP